jgi:hypothetical protein
MDDNSIQPSAIDIDGCHMMTPKAPNRTTGAKFRENFESSLIEDLMLMHPVTISSVSNQNLGKFSPHQEKENMQNLVPGEEEAENLSKRSYSQLKLLK